MNEESDRACLLSILQKAYSGELAAAYAYRGHWKSLKDPYEIAKIRQIEDEEWVHRQNVGRMLQVQGAEPVKLREIRCWIVGHVIAIGCHLIGWFLPMYFAGRLESGNTEEYAIAALHAARLGLTDFERELMVMSAVEKEHELFFLGVISGHPLLPFVSSVFKWGAPSTSSAASAQIDENAASADPVDTTGYS
jgi:hypothetical protein